MRGTVVWLVVNADGHTVRVLVAMDVGNHRSVGESSSLGVLGTVEGILGSMEDSLM